MSAEARKVLYIAFELSSKEWKLAMATGPTRRPRIVNVPARSTFVLCEAVDAARGRFELDADCEVLTCHEAGRDGFSVHRLLVDLGYQSLVIDASSIEVSRRKRRAKTDRLDAQRMLSKLVQYVQGDEDVWAVVRPPSEAVEDERRLHRERAILVKEQTKLVVRIKSWLATIGLPLEVDAKLLGRLEDHRTLWGGAVPPQLKSQIRRTMSRLELIREQLREIAAEMKQRLAEPKTVGERRAAGLTELLGIGPVSAWTLAHEFLWRDFANRRQVASAAGLTGTPYDSGDTEWEQGIDKAGSSRIRTLMVELAWGWPRYQKGSALTKWFEERYAKGGKRSRRKGIVALARKLLIALWKFDRWGEVPAGAVGNDRFPLEQLALEVA